MRLVSVVKYYCYSLCAKLLGGRYIEKAEKYRFKISGIPHCNDVQRYYTFYEKNGEYIKRNGMGKHSYAGDYFCVSNRETTVGNFTSIADNVTLGTTFHPVDWISTSPFTYFEAMKLNADYKQETFVYSKKVVVGNDVWIGKHVTVMDGITINDGAIIGTNAVVTKDVPPYAIVVGVPAKILRYRFDKPTIEALLRLKWWDLDDAEIAQLPFRDVAACVEKLKKLRGETV